VFYAICVTIWAIIVTVQSCRREEVVLPPVVIHEPLPTPAPSAPTTENLQRGISDFIKSLDIYDAHVEVVLSTQIEDVSSAVSDIVAQTPYKILIQREEGGEVSYWDRKTLNDIPLPERGSVEKEFLEKYKAFLGVLVTE
jgi:hypothetical protein